MFRNILIAIDIDDSEGYRQILQQALDCVDRSHGKVRLIYVRSDLPTSWRDFLPPDFDGDEQERCEASLAGIARQVDFPAERVSVVVRMGSVHNEALREARACGAELIAVGPHRKKMSDILLGSSASALVYYSEIPILVIR